MHKSAHFILTTTYGRAYFYFRFQERKLRHRGSCHVVCIRSDSQMGGSARTEARIHHVPWGYTGSPAFPLQSCPSFGEQLEATTCLPALCPSHRNSILHVSVTQGGTTGHVAHLTHLEAGGHPGQGMGCHLCTRVLLGTEMQLNMRSHSWSVGSGTTKSGGKTCLRLKLSRGERPERCGETQA